MIKNKQSLAAISVLIAMTSSVYAQRDHGDANTLIIGGSLYSLDLAEQGLEKNPRVYVNAEEIESVQKQKTLQDGFSKHRIQVGYLTDKGRITGIQKRHSFYDNKDRGIFNSILGVSDIFGVKGADTNGSGRFYYTTEAWLASALTNKLYEIVVVSPKFSKNILDKMKSLNWALVNYQFEPNEDSTATAKEPSIYTVAKTTEAQIKISTFGWKNKFKIGDDWIQPLDYRNQMALITHEIFYSIADSQGDVDSDRVREANALLYVQRDISESLLKSCRLLYRNDLEQCE